MRKTIFIDCREQLKNKNKGILDLFVKLTREDKYEIISNKELLVGDVQYIEIDELTNIVVKDIVVERKKLDDVLCSIEDDRTVLQYEGAIDYSTKVNVSRVFTVIIGTDWEKAIYKHNYYKKEYARAPESYYLSMIEVLVKYSTSGLNILQVPDVKCFVKLCLKLFSRNVEKVIKHKIIIDHSNKQYENLARSIACLTDGLGIKTAIIIAKHFASYDEILCSNPLIISNIIRKENNKKEGKKPIKTIVRFWNDCGKRRGEPDDEEESNDEQDGVQVQEQENE